MGVIIQASGLAAVADPAGQSGRGGRDREVWTKADRQLFDRFAKMVRLHGDRVILRCGNKLCPERDIKLTADASEERGAVLRCGCTDRCFARF